jgi:hypothetical protein
MPYLSASRRTRFIATMVIGGLLALGLAGCTASGSNKFGTTSNGLPDESTATVTRSDITPVVTLDATV